MKTKIILSAGLLFSNMFIASAIAANEEPLSLKIKKGDSESGHKPYPLKPIQIPYVCWDGHILSFDSSLEGCTVRLLDSDGIKCFSVLITEEMTEIAPPLTFQANTNCRSSAAISFSIAIFNCKYTEFLMKFSKAVYLQYCFFIFFNKLIILINNEIK